MVLLVMVVYLLPKPNVLAKNTCTCVTTLINSSSKMLLQVSLVYRFNENLDSSSVIHSLLLALIFDKR